MSVSTTAAIISALAAAGETGYAAYESSSAQKDAANTALQGTQAGLDFLKAQKAKQEAAAAPYLALGQQATSMLPSAVRPSPVGGPPMPYTTQPRATMPSLPMSGFSAPQMPQNAPLAASSGLVTLQAPDGSTRQVPQEQAQFYISRGAKAI